MVPKPTREGGGGGNNLLYVKTVITAYSICLYHLCTLLTGPNEQSGMPVLKAAGNRKPNIIVFCAHEDSPDYV